MAEVTPFHGLRYDEAKAGPLADVICPPYDVISEQLRADLYAQSPHNIVRVEFGSNGAEAGDGDRYTRARKFLDEWTAKGVLRYDHTRAFYLADHYFELGGERLRRRGIFCALRLYQEGRGIVRPHEKTFPKPKADRLALLRATRTNTSPVFGMVADPKGELATSLERWMAHGPARLVADTHLGKERHLIWALDDPPTARKLAGLLRDERVYIADGHHRYETGLMYLREQQEAKQIELDEDTPNYILAYLCTLDDPGLRILPTHRVIRGAREAVDAAITRSFNAAPLDPGALDLRAAGVVHVRGGVMRSLSLRRGQDAALPEAWRALPVAHAELILRPAREAGAEIAYEHETARAVEAARGDEADAILVAPVSSSDLQRVADAWEKLPEKTTYFYPKVPAGLVLRPLGD
jgi:uncharacterized protein (DUF1015 family)